MFKLVFLVATVMGLGAAEIHTNQTYDSIEDCQAAVSEHTAWVDGDLKVTYHCVEAE